MFYGTDEQTSFNFKKIKFHFAFNPWQTFNIILNNLKSLWILKYIQIEATNKINLFYYLKLDLINENNKTET